MLECRMNRIKVSIFACIFFAMQSYSMEERLDFVEDDQKLNEQFMWNVWQGCYHVKPGVDVNYISKGRKSWSALMVAAWRNDQHTCDFLLKKAANIDYIDKDGKTALIIAAIHASQDLVCFLINSGADLKYISEDGNSALTYAMKNERHAISEFLLLEMFKLNGNPQRKRVRTLLTCFARNFSRNYYLVLCQVFKDLLCETIDQEEDFIFQQICKQPDSKIKQFLLNKYFSQRKP